MGTLLELTFPHMPLSQAMALTNDILNASDGPPDVVVDTESWEKAPELSKITAAMKSRVVLNVACAILPRAGAVPNVSIFLMRMDNVYTVELDVDLDDVADHEALSRGLYDFAAELAEKHSIQHYFAGLEPAWDEDTRIFTGRNWGPLRL